MLAHGDKELESLLLNVENPDWRKQVEAKAGDILSMVCLHFTGMHTALLQCQAAQIIGPTAQAQCERSLQYCIHTGRTLSPIRNILKQCEHSPAATPGCTQIETGFACHHALQTRTWLHDSGFCHCDCPARDRWAALQCLYSGVTAPRLLCFVVSACFSAKQYSNNQLKFLAQS